MRVFLVFAQTVRSKLKRHGFDKNSMMLFLSERSESRRDEATMADANPTLSANYQIDLIGSNLTLLLAPGESFN